MDREPIEEGILKDNVEVLDETEDEKNEIIEPQVGMTFDKSEEVFKLFKEYGKQMGFPVKIRSSKKDDDGLLKYMILSCSREGKKIEKSKNVLKPTPSVRHACQVRLTTSLDADGKWQIKKLNLDHNHLVSPSKSRYFPCNREINPNVKRQLEIADISGIRVPKNYNACVVEAGGHENLTFLERDCRNYIEKVRRLRLGEGDALAVQSYFLKMQAQNSGFFFSMDLDDEGTLKNIFWADGRSREAYKEFGEVVTFDTTYLTNKYAMPFAPFVGVNHHGQSILFGCDLVSSEDTDTFVWLFRTWLTCMSGCAPQGIITDQDRAMQNAIEIVFPNARHRWCLWHVMKKLPEKFKSYSCYESISLVLQSAVYDSQNPHDFEQKWSALLDAHRLHQNDWLSGLYNERHRWVPAYVKVNFWAGMSTTQRSEGINAFFDGYVHVKTTLKQFVGQYDNALKSKVEKENQADFRSFSQTIQCITSYKFEQQVEGVYTLTKFREFQKELTAGGMYCVIMNAREGGYVTEYDIRENVQIGDAYTKRMIFTVVFRRQDCDVKCSCHLFEFKGLLCKHVIKVFILNDITLIPDKYILRRWRKDVSRCHTKVSVNYNGWRGTPEQKRYGKMYFDFTKVADMASKDQRLYDHVIKRIDNVATELSTMSLSSAAQHTTSSVSDIIIDSEGNVKQHLRDPNPVNAKGRPQWTRLISITEREVTKKKKKHIRTKEKNGHTKDSINKRKKQNKRSQFSANMHDGQTSTSTLLEVRGETQGCTQESMSLGNWHTPPIHPDSQCPPWIDPYGLNATPTYDFGGVAQVPVETYNTSSTTNAINEQEFFGLN